MQHPHLMQTPPWLLEDSYHNREPYCWQYVIWIWIHWGEAQDRDKMQQFGQEPGARGRASGDIISPPAPLLFQKEFKLLQGHVGRATHSWAHKPTGQGKETRPPLLCPAPCTKAPPSKTPSPSSCCTAGGCCGAAGCWPDTAGCGGSSSSSFCFGRDKVALK